MAETNYFGFKKVQDGAMVFGKDLNKVLDSIDERLHEALGAMSEAGAAAVAAVGSAAWTQIPFDDEVEIIFASSVRLTKARLMFVNGTLGVNVAQVALALASAPAVPITTPVDITGVSGDHNLPFPTAVEVDADEEIILIEMDKLAVGFVAAADIQVVVEGNKV